MFKVSLAMLVIQGLVGPKLRPKGVDDGHAVNIRQLLIFRLSYGVTGKEMLESQFWDSSCKLVSVGKSADMFPPMADENEQ